MSLTQDLSSHPSALPGKDPDDEDSGVIFPKDQLGKKVAAKLGEEYTDMWM